jgi:cytochrome c peroxidase
MGCAISSSYERRDLIAFLEALTDQQFLTDPRFSDPWTDAE